MLILLLSFSGFPQEKKRSTLSSGQITEVVDSLSKALENYYTFPDKGAKMSAYLKNQFKKGIYQHITDPAKLAYRLETDIRKINYDAHLHINFDPNVNAPKDLSPEERDKVEKEQLQAEKENNFNIRKVEILPGDIGYFRFDGFTPYTEEAKPTLTAALTFLSNTKALIIDLRYNGGGSTINQLASYFFNKRTHLYDQVSTMDKDTVSIYTNSSPTNGAALLMPLYILTSKNTASAAEAFTASMKSLKRAIVIGDTTLGASHFTGFFPIGHGFIAMIPIARPVNTATFKDWEGIGVVPNISVPAATALQKAREVIYQAFLNNAKTERQKRIIQWSINELKGEDNFIISDTTILNTYVGTYVGGINFYVEKGKLLCKNPERGGTDIFKLKAISDHVFLLDENAQVEFLKNAGGTYSVINLLFKDGNVIQKSRELKNKVEHLEK